ncbi:Protein ecm33 [Smittium mucronatum]|uniref:Protein ecm33 n=1 Tax=Smittium mucronatum TaxID=133383 RepID=A0A1R0GRJ7_9FUNG|nr:Protein ecm33 [Smittium mucronatum]OLY83743.1 Protein ecm33 [Smittium mucronatum]
MFIFSCLALFLSLVSAQCTKDINLMSQADVDSISNCTVIIGNVAIPSSSLTTIDLSNIERINGAFHVSGNDDLTSLKLDGLISMTGDFFMINNDALVEFSAKSLLVANNINITLNTNLAKLDLSSLSQVFDFEISLKSLKSIEGGLLIGENQNLSSVTMPELINIDQGLLITYNMDLLNIDENSFPKLSTIGVGAMCKGGFETFLLPEIKNITEFFIILTNGCLDCLSVYSKIEKYVDGTYICKVGQIPFSESDDYSIPSGYSINPTEICTVIGNVSELSTEYDMSNSQYVTTSEISSRSSQSSSSISATSGSLSFIESISLSQTFFIFALVITIMV